MLIVDPGDLSKKYAKKTEYRATVRDGSAHDLAQGYWTPHIADCGLDTQGMVAEGDTATAYQWKKDGANIDGANESACTLSDPAPNDSANYSVEVSDTNGDSIESPPARLTVSLGLPVTGVIGPAMLAAMLSSLTVRRRRGLVK